MPTRLAATARSLEGAVITKAVMRAASLLALTNKQLAGIIGVSEATVSRMRAGTYTLASGDKPFELSVLVVRLYRSLDAIVGGDDETSRQWMHNSNQALNGVPLELIQKVTGLVDVIAYLDTRRALV